MRRIAFAFILLFLSCGVGIVAQNEAQLSQYWAFPGYINPAAVAAGDKLSVAALNRMQWTGIPNAPKTFLITAETPFRFLKQNHAVGLLVVSDKAGLFSTNTFALQYAFQKRLGSGRLSLGLRLGAIDQVFDGTKVDIPATPDHAPSDEAIPRTSVSAMAMDAAFGAYYHHKSFYAGISATHLTSPELELDEKSYAHIETVYYLTAGGNIELSNPLYELQPSVLFKSDLRAYQADFTLRMVYNKMFWGGVSYRWGDAVVILAGAEFKGVRVGYSYDISTSAIAAASNGSHEVFASYNIKLNIGPKTKNKHKSIRIL